MDTRIQQVSVFLENTFGRLDEVLQVLADGGVDLVGLSIADTSDFGLLRIIVNDAEKALALLRAGGYTAKASGVFALTVPDSPGGLAGVMRLLKKRRISIEYLYSLVRRVEGRAVIILRVDDADKARQLFDEAGIRLLTRSEIEAKTAP